MVPRTTSLATTILVLLLAAPCAHAAWPAGGLQLEKSASALSTGQPAIGSDGLGGTYVAWFETDSLGAMAFRLHRLTSGGDPPPGWTTAGVRACSPATWTLAPGLLTDGAGGAYVHWTDTPSPAVWVVRLGPDGAPVAGWPAQGLPVSDSAGQIDVVAADDGTGGILLAWSRNVSGTTKEIVVQRFLADGSRASGFPAAGLPVTTHSMGQTGKFRPRLVRDADRGFWLSFTTVGLDTLFVPSTYSVLHLEPSGLRTAGQPADGLALSLPASEVGTATPYAPVALGLDGAGGVFAFTLGSNGNVRAFHVLADASEDPAWPVGGVVLAGGADWPSTIMRIEDNWPVAAGDLQGAAYVGWRDGSDFYHLRACRIETDGAITSGWSSTPAVAGSMFDAVVADANGVYFASTVPTGCAHFNCTGPHMITRLEPGGAVAPGWPESNPPPVTVPGIILDYGNAGVAPQVVDDGAGGLVATWIRYTGVAEYYALRFTAAGTLTGVDPAALSAVVVHPRFDPGAGVRVSFSLGGAAEGRIELFDVAGRRVALERLSAPSGEVVVPGTRDLQTGLYFVRLTCGSQSARTKVAVAR